MIKFNFDRYQRQREDFYKNVENIIEGLKAEPHMYTIMLYPTLEKSSTYQEASIYKQTERVLSIETCSSYFIMYDPKSNLEISIRANTDIEEKNCLQYAINETYSDKEEAMVGINVTANDDGSYVAEKFIQQINIIDDKQGAFTLNSMVDDLEVERVLVDDEDEEDYPEHEEMTDEEILEDSTYDEELEEYDDSDIEVDNESEEIQERLETVEISRNGIDISKTFSSEEINKIILANIKFGEQITEDFDYTIQIIQNIRDQIQRRLRMFSKPRNNHKEDKEK